MKAYFDSIEKEVPEQLQQVFLNRRDTAVITIDMHDGHLATDPYAVHVRLREDVRSSNRSIIS